MLFILETQPFFSSSAWPFFSPSIQFTFSQAIIKRELVEGEEAEDEKEKRSFFSMLHNRFEFPYTKEY